LFLSLLTRVLAAAAVGRGVGSFPKKSARRIGNGGTALLMEGRGEERARKSGHWETKTSKHPRGADNCTMSSDSESSPS